MIGGGQDAFTELLIKDNLVKLLKGGQESGQGGMFGMPAAMAPNPMQDMPKMPGMQK